MPSDGWCQWCPFAGPRCFGLGVSLLSSGGPACRVEGFFLVSFWGRGSCPQTSSAAAVLQPDGEAGASRPHWRWRQFVITSSTKYGVLTYDLVFIACGRVRCQMRPDYAIAVASSDCITPSRAARFALSDQCQPQLTVELDHQSGRQTWRPVARTARPGC